MPVRICEYLWEVVFFCIWAYEVNLLLGELIAIYETQISIHIIKETHLTQKWLYWLDKYQVAIKSVL